MSKAKLSSKGQVTIPADVRERLDLQQGDWIVFEPTERGVLVRKASKVIGDLYGSVPALKVPWKKAREMAWRARAEELERKSSAIRTSSSGS